MKLRIDRAWLMLNWNTDNPFPWGRTLTTTAMINTPLLLSPRQVSSLIRRPGVLLVDARPFRDYHRGHIGGAVDLPLTEYHWADTTPGGIRAFTKQMERVLGFIGVDRKKHAIFYEETSGMMAARGVWLLHYLGHRKASMIDGGLRAWKRAGYKTTTDPTPPKPANFKARANPTVLATMDYVLRLLKNPRTTLVDVRSPEEYDGTLVRAAHGGHIPRAVNVDWKQTLTRKGTFKPRDELEQLYDREGVGKDNEIITYCQAGYRAAQAFVVLKILGYENVRNYLGSWFEYGNAQGNPIEKLS